MKQIVRHLRAAQTEDKRFALVMRAIYLNGSQTVVRISAFMAFNLKLKTSTINMKVNKIRSNNRSNV
jgi:hypothetical protein